VFYNLIALLQMARQTRSSDLPVSESAEAL
jgi:hypothetical protein